MGNDDLETIRLDAGGPYVWPVGEMTLVTVTSVCASCDDVHIDMSLYVDGDVEGGTAVKAKGRIGLVPWSVSLDVGDGVPPEIVPKLTRLLDKHKDEIAFRGARLLDCRERDVWQSQDLTGLRADTLVRYRNMFPADFDLIYALSSENDERVYFVEDYLCLVDGCDCGLVGLNITQLDDDGGKHKELGAVTVDITAKPVNYDGPKNVVAVARSLFAESDLHRTLKERRLEYRRIAPLVAKRVGVTKPAEIAVRKAKVGRNDPCVCGSGKKYKKCCLGKDTA